MNDKHSYNFLLKSRHKISKNHKLIHIGFNLDSINYEDHEDYEDQKVAKEYPMTERKCFENSNSLDSKIKNLYPKNHRNYIFLNNLKGNLMPKPKFVIQSSSLKGIDQSQMQSSTKELLNFNLNLNKEILPNISSENNAGRVQVMNVQNSDSSNSSKTSNLNITTLKMLDEKLDQEKLFIILRNEVLTIWKCHKVFETFNKSFLDFITNTCYLKDLQTFLKGELNKIYSKSSSFILIPQTIQEREKNLISLKEYVGSILFSQRELIGAKILDDVLEAFNYVRYQGLEIVENLNNIRSDPFISLQISLGNIQVFAQLNDENYLCKMVSDLVFLSYSHLSKYFNFSPGFDPFLHELSNFTVNYANSHHSKGNSLNFFTKFKIPITKLTSNRIKIAEKIILNEFNTNLELPENYRSEIQSYFTKKINEKPKVIRILKTKKQMPLSKDALKILDILNANQPVEPKLTQIHHYIDKETKTSPSLSKGSPRAKFGFHFIQPNIKESMSKLDKICVDNIMEDKNLISHEDEIQFSPSHSGRSYNRKYPLISIDYIEKETKDEVVLKPLNVNSKELINLLNKYDEIIPYDFKMAFSCKEDLFRQSKEGCCPQWLMFEEESMKGLVVYHRKIDQSYSKIVEILHSSCCTMDKFPSLLKTTIKHIWETEECDEIITRISYIQTDNAIPIPNNIIENLFYQEGFSYIKQNECNFVQCTLMYLQRPSSSFSVCRIQKDCLILGINYLMGMSHLIKEDPLKEKSIKESSSSIKMAIIAALLNIKQFSLINLSTNINNINNQNLIAIPEEIKAAFFKYNDKINNPTNTEIKTQNIEGKNYVKWPNLSSINSKSLTDIINFYSKLCPIRVLKENIHTSEYIGTKQKVNLNFNGYIYEKRALNGIDYHYMRIWSSFQYAKHQKFEAIKFFSSDYCFSIIIVKYLLNENSESLENSKVFQSGEYRKFEKQNDIFESEFSNIIWKENLIEEVLLPSFQVKLNSDELIQNLKIKDKFLNTVWSDISLQMLSDKQLPFNLQYVNSNSTFIIDDEFLLYIVSNLNQNIIEIPIISIYIRKSYWQTY